MVWLTLLFIFTLTTVSEVTSLYCSDQQLPASGDDDLQQVLITVPSRGLILCVLLLIWMEFNNLSVITISTVNLTTAVEIGHPV